jgi:hypothetical protein
MLEHNAPAVQELAAEHVGTDHLPLGLPSVNE